MFVGYLVCDEHCADCTQRPEKAGNLRKRLRETLKVEVGNHGFRREKKKKKAREAYLKKEGLSPD